MQKSIKLLLADGGEKEMQFRTTGTTSMRYRTLTGTELMDDLMRIYGLFNGGSEDESDEVQIQQVTALLSTGGDKVIERLAYIENCSAEGADMSALDDDGYFDWLDQFEPLEILNNANFFLDLYMASRKGRSKLKKNKS